MTEKKRKIADYDSNEQVLSNYVDNKIKLMQEVLSLIKPKKIMRMAPDFMKNMQISVVKSLLLEELLGMSNKRLRCILAGVEGVDSSSSSESEIDDKKPDDTLSLQEISDNSDCCIDIEVSEKERMELEKDNANSSKLNIEVKTESIKHDKRKDKHKKRKTSKKELKTEPEPVVNVLNLLELQARARAIRSQLANEILTNKDSKVIEKQTTENTEVLSHDENSTDSVICLSPDNLSVVSIDSNSNHEDEIKSVENNNSNSNHGDELKSVENNSSHSNHEDEIKSVENNSSNSNHEDEIKSVENNSPKLKTVEETSQESDEEKVTGDAESNKWKARWLESNKVQQVLKNSKLYNNLRHSRKQKNSPKEAESTDNNNV